MDPVCPIYLVHIMSDLETVFATEFQSEGAREAEWSIRTWGPGLGRCRGKVNGWREIFEGSQLRSLD